MTKEIGPEIQEIPKRVNQEKIEAEKAFWAEYHRRNNLREIERAKRRNIPAVVHHFGETVELEGWHTSIPPMRNADALDNFGNSQTRVAPTKGK
jgi:hypothetical protein